MSTRSLLKFTNSKPLLKIFQSRNFTLANLKIFSSPKPNLADELRDACMAGDYNAVNSIVTLPNIATFINDSKKGPCFNGYTALHHACKQDFKQDSNIVSLLLKYGASVQAITGQKLTPLHIATKSNNPLCISMLLSNGADINSTDDQGLTSLMHAATLGFSNIVDLLMENNAHASLLCNNGCTALIYAASNSNFECAEILVNKSATINYTCKDGANALMYACGRFENHKIVELLVKNGANVNNITHKTKYSTLMLTCYSNDIDSLRLLLDYGVNIDSVNSSGLTALMIASLFGYIDCVRLLLDRNADVDIKSNKGDTAESFAEKRKYYDIAILLNITQYGTF